jgi:hypothetical protein
VLTRIRTAIALGPRNIARVLTYQLRIRTGTHPVQRLAPGTPPRPPFFVPPAAPSTLPAPLAWRETAIYFGWLRMPQLERPPDWHRNQLNGVPAPDGFRDWWSIRDFDPALGDIKGLWEASRFDWVVNIAQQARATDGSAVSRLNAWLSDWCERNPPYRGHNWKCGQEASIRVMHLAVAALLLGQIEAPVPALVELVAVHLRRIAPTLMYAVAQDNNHGTSEAAALFIGGSWLGALGRSEGRSWADAGRTWLENRAARLIQEDGSFSQHSINYHRLMLDTFSLAEIWRRRLQAPPFSDRLLTRAVAATEWLRAMVDPVTGDAPNLGGNDGANLLPLTDADFRDYRPSVQLAAALFRRAAAYSNPGPWRTQLDWLGVALPHDNLPRAGSAMFDAGGYAVLQRDDAKAVLRYPRFRFRPSHADAMHVDFWVSGENLLRDGGSFSYHADAETHAYFTGARAHNTVQFDDREQMPRLGRFLWGAWLTTDGLQALQSDGNVATVAASCRDAGGAVHARRLELQPGKLTVRDSVSQFARRAVLRWRLRPGDWSRDGGTVSDGHHRLSVSASVPIVRCELVSGWESRYYGRRTAIPVLEVEIANAGVLTSDYRWVP